MKIFLWVIKTPIPCLSIKCRFLGTPLLQILRVCVYYVPIAGHCRPKNANSGDLKMAFLTIGFEHTAVSVLQFRSVNCVIWAHSTERQ